MAPAAPAQSNGPVLPARPSYSGVTTVSLTHVRSSAVSVSMRRVHPSDTAPAAPVGTGVGGGAVGTVELAGAVAVGSGTTGGAVPIGTPTTKRW